MALTLYNTATKKKEIFSPLEEGRIGIYVCGVTVYDLCHIGHARSAIVFDVLVRYLRARGFDVTYVRNFTDVDDKIISRANQVGKEPRVLAREFIDAFYEDMHRLWVSDADIEPKATEHIDGMIQMITKLIERGHAYVSGDDVFFSVESFKEYGKLSGRKLEDMQAGSRIAVDEKKKHPMDFVLWKGAKPGEPQWESPWGNGRPGWHIECSVMSNQYLGPSFDIHGGGKDLLFPHHENERAQSIGANDGIFANFWVHNGFVTVEGEKMSKSLGNFLTIRDAFELFPPQVLRLFLISKHYRSPIDFSKNGVIALQSGLIRIYRTLQRVEEVIGPAPEKAYRMGENSLSEAAVSEMEDSDETFLRELVHVMDDDLNTAGAIALLFENIKSLNKILDSGEDLKDEALRARMDLKRRQLLVTGRVLGLLRETPKNFFDQLAQAEPRIDQNEIEKLIEQRTAARAGKDWTRADEIRDRLKDMGIILEDGPQGTTWRRDV